MPAAWTANGAAAFSELAGQRGLKVVVEPQGSDAAEHA
jgi:hypothetical protein